MSDPLLYTSLTRRRNPWSSLSDNVITITQQPASTTVAGTFSNAAAGTLANVTQRNQGIVYAGSKWAFLRGAKLYQSSDGLSFSELTSFASSVPSPGSALAYGNGKLIAFYNTAADTQYGGSVAVSTDEGASFTLAGSAAPPLAVRKVVFSSGRFVAVGSEESTATTQAIWSSTDGTTWSPSTLATAAAAYDVAHGNGRWVAIASSTLNYIGTSTPYLLTSTDGTTWSPVTVGTYAWTNIAFAAGVFVMSGFEQIQTGNQFNINRAVTAVSANGINWTVGVLPQAASNDQEYVASLLFHNVYYAAGVFLAAHGFQQSLPGAGNVTYSAIYSSPDGSVWTRVTESIQESPALNLLGATSSAWFATEYTTGPTVQLRRITRPAPSATFSTTATSSAGKPLVYQWQRYDPQGLFWQNITSANGSSYTFTSPTTANSGTRFRCEVQSASAAGKLTSAATLTVT